MLVNIIWRRFMLGVYSQLIVFSSSVISNNEVDIEGRLKTIEYDKVKRPFLEEKPVTVEVQYYFHSVGPFNEKDLTFHVGLYMRQWWMDPRIARLNLTGQIALSRMDLIWKPNLSIQDAVNVAVMLPYYQRIVLEPGGLVHTSVKTEVTSRCYMNLHHHPMDTQRCRMVLESFAFNKNDILLKWNKEPFQGIDYLPTIEGYELLDIIASHEASAVIVGNATQSYMLLISSFVVQRELTYFVFRVFVPSLLLISISIGSFWIPDHVISARISMIVTSFLVNMYILQSVSESIIKVSYVTPMQSFLVANITFIVMVLMEYLTVLRLRTEEQESRQRYLSKRNALVIGNVNNMTLNLFGPALENKGTSNNNIATSARNKPRSSEEARKILEASNRLIKTHPMDQYSRIIFPIVYCVFLIAFFTFYMTRKHSEGHL